MTVSPDTYISQTLALFNWRTHPRRPDDRYPGGRPRRFAGRVDRVLLSSEPYHFKERHVAEVAAAVPGAEVSLIDGEMTSWYGSRAIAGLRYLDEYARSVVRRRPADGLARLAVVAEPAPALASEVAAVDERPDVLGGGSARRTARACSRPRAAPCPSPEKSERVKRAHGVVERLNAGEVDVLGRGYPLLDDPCRLQAERDDQPRGDEARRVLVTDDGLLP